MAERSIQDELQELSKKGLTSRKIIILRGPLQDGTPVVEQREGSIIDDEGLKELTVATLSYAPACHHLIHTEAELGAICVICGQAMCSVCSASSLCSLCGRAVCKQDQKSVEDVGIICSQCHRELIRKKIISFILTAGAVGILIYLVLRFL